MSDIRRVIRLKDGQQIRVPDDLIVARPDGGFFLMLSADDLPPEAESDTTEASAVDTRERLVVPIVAEEFTVGKRTVETGRIRIHQTVDEREEQVDEPLLHQTAAVETVPINRMIAQHPLNMAAQALNNIKNSIARLLP